MYFPRLCLSYAVFFLALPPARRLFRFRGVNSVSKRISRRLTHESSGACLRSSLETPFDLVCMCYGMCVRDMCEAQLLRLIARLTGVATGTRCHGALGNSSQVFLSLTAVPKHRTQSTTDCNTAWRKVECSGPVVARPSGRQSSNPGGHRLPSTPDAWLLPERVPVSRQLMKLHTSSKMFQDVPQLPTQALPSDATPTSKRCGPRATRSEYLRDLGQDGRTGRTALAVRCVEMCTLCR